MFGRHVSQDRDIVAAAQRRLAALAAQQRGMPGRDPAPEQDDSGRHSPSPRHAPAESATTPAEPQPGPRHLGPRRTELARWGVSAQHVAVAALLVVGLVVAVAWWALRSVPRAEPVQMSSQRVLPSSPAPGPPAATVYPGPPSSSGGSTVGGPGPTSAPARLVVDVAGKVRHPGIVELPAGSRVVDAIAAAGGARPGVALTALNLARLLVDGEQIVVGIDVPLVGGGGAGGSGATAGSTDAPAAVDLNTASAEQLETLPDVGPVTAQAILTWRTENGSFSSVDELLDVSGIGPATLADIRPFVYV